MRGNNERKQRVFVLHLKVKTVVVPQSNSKCQTTTRAVPGGGQIYRCLRKELLCSAWCHLPHLLPPYLVQCLWPCLAVNKGINGYKRAKICHEMTNYKE